MHPRRLAGVRRALGSAIAVLAGARVAAATPIGGAAALASFVFADVGHFHVPFFVAQQRANHHIASVPWYRVKLSQSLTIGRLAAAGGVGVETVRFYQRRGLLDTPTRDDGIRRYGSGDLRRLRFIKQAQAAGFTLEQIKELLDLDASNDRSRVRALANERLAALDGRIAELKQARDALKRLAHDAAAVRPDHVRS